MSETNKALVRRFYDEVMNRGNLDVIDELCTPDVVDHRAQPGLPPGTDGVKHMMAMYRAVFPDLVVTLEDMVAEGDRVVVRWSGRGTHKGNLGGGLPPPARR